MIFAHPGHELLVLSAVRRTAPLVAIISDGSGSTGLSRIAYSNRILQMAGATRSSLFGRYSDKACYDFIRRIDPKPFVKMRDSLVDECLALGIEQIVSDACEYYNPVHDIASYIADGVTRRLRSKSKRSVHRFAIPIAPPDGSKRTGQTNKKMFPLGQTQEDAGFKLNALAVYEPLANEIRNAKTQEGEAYLQENLSEHEPIVRPDESLVFEPSYERVGRERIAADIYSDLITYEDHIKPIAKEIL